MATDKIPNPNSQLDYFSSYMIRGVAIGVNTSSEKAIIFPFFLKHPYGETRSIIVNYASAAGIGEMTAVVDNSRTNKDEITFKLTKSGFTPTTNSSYLVYVNFTINRGT